VALNVQDLDHSEHWYAEALGFTRLAPFKGDRFERVIMRHPSGVVVGLTKHDDPEATAKFNERRTGLDFSRSRCRRVTSSMNGPHISMNEV
jgi:hypothetical protein